MTTQLQKQSNIPSWPHCWNLTPHLPNHFRILQRYLPLTQNPNTAASLLEPNTSSTEPFPNTSTIQVVSTSFTQNPNTAASLLEPNTSSTEPFPNTSFTQNPNTSTTQTTSTSFTRNAEHDIISELVDELFGPGDLDRYIEHVENADEGIDVNILDELKLDLEPFDFELEALDF